MGKLDLEPVPEGAAHLDLEPVEESVLDKKIPVLDPLSRGVHDVAETTQAAAGDVGERVAQATGSQAAGVAAGVAGALASTGTEFLSRMVPTTVKDIAIMAATEGLGRSGSAALRLLQEPAVNREMAPVAQRAVAAAATLNIPLTLAQIKNSKSWSMVEKMLNRIPVAADTMHAFYQKQSEALATAKTELLRALGPVPSEVTLGRKTIEQAGGKISGLDADRAAAYAAEKAKITDGMPSPELPEARGAAIISAKEKTQQAALDTRKALYKWRDEALPNKASVVLPNTPITSAVQDVLKGYPEGAPQRLAKNKFMAIIGEPETGLKLDPQFAELAKTDPKMAEILSNKKAAASGVAPASGGYTFDQLDNVVKRLSDEAEKERFTEGSRRGDYTTKGKEYLQLKKAAEGVMDDYFNAQGGEAAKRNQIAKAFHADYASTFRSKEVASLYDKEPVKVFQAAVKSGRPETVQLLSRALGPNGTTILKRQLFDDVFSVDGEIPKKVDVLNRMNQYGPALRVLFNPAEQAQWKQFATTGEAPRFLQTEYERAVRNLITHSPQDIPDVVLNGDVLTARAIKRYVHPDVFAGFGAKLAEKIITPTGSAEAGTAGILTRLNRYEDSYLHTFFDPKTVRGMKMIGEASRILPGYGDLANRPVNGRDAALMYGAMGAMIAPTRMMKIMAPLMIGSNALARMYTSEEGQRILTTLMRMPEIDPRLPKVLMRAAQLGYLSHLPTQTVQAKQAIDDMKVKKTSEPDPDMSKIGGLREAQ